MIEPTQGTLITVMRACRAAGALCRQMQPGVVAGVRSGAGERKADGTDVTIADYASQALLVHILAQDLPLPAVVAEESADALAARPDLLGAVTDALQDSGHWPGVRPADILDALAHRAWDTRTKPPGCYWAIDPIDGTKGFAAGRQFAVCVALMNAGRPVLAALACPNLPLESAPALLRRPASTGTQPPASGPGTTIGGLGAGPQRGLIVQDVATSLDQPVELRAVLARGLEVTRAPVFTFAVEPSEGRVTDLRRLGEKLGALDEPLACDSQAKYALVARGDADVYYRPPRRGPEKVWDHAAGCLLLELAGCVVTDVRGRAMDWSSPVLSGSSGVLGAPGGLHAQIVAALGAG